MTTQAEELYTVAELMQRHRSPRWQVKDCIRALRIDAAKIAGRVHLYDADADGRIKREIDRRRERRGEGL